MVKYFCYWYNKLWNVWLALTVAVGIAWMARKMDMSWLVSIFSGIVMFVCMWIGSIFYSIAFVVLKGSKDLGEKIGRKSKKFI